MYVVGSAPPKPPAPIPGWGVRGERPTHRGGTECHMNPSPERQPFPQATEKKHPWAWGSKKRYSASRERSLQACVMNLQEKKWDPLFLRRPRRQTIYNGSNIGALILTRLVPAQLGTDRAPDGDLSD